MPFASEVSVIAARGREGDFRAYDVCENVHEHHILATTVAPAELAERDGVRAIDIARRIAEAADYVGVIAVEMFVVEAGGRRDGCVVNEIAPRVHNSGHWTLDGATPRNSSSICAPWPAGRSARRAATAASRCAI